MGFLVPVTLFGWIPFVILLFILLPPRRAVIAAFLLAWLFLPMAGYGVKGLPDYTKMSATTFGVLIGAALFDTDRLLQWRPKWIDIPMLLWCTSPMVSSYVNGFGLYDGCAEIVRQFIIWGLPYVIGRIYFNDLESLRELAIGIFIGGLIYVPFCWFEVRFSPQLHKWIYGFRQHSFIQNVRDGGYRPMVFMQHGLMVGMWMGMTTLIGLWLWRSKTIQKVWDIPMYLLMPAMLLTVYLCKSKYAVLLLATGIGALYLTKLVRTKALLVCLLLVPLTYTMLRATGAVTGEGMISLAAQVFGEERAASLGMRINNENLLAQRAMEKPFFGWGAWGGARVQGENGKDLITDSLWIITLGKYGWVGLLGLMGTLLLPMILVIRDWRVELWQHPLVGPVVVLAMVCTLYMFDHLMNGMVNPIFMLAAGAVGSAHFVFPRMARRATPRQMVQARPVFGAQPRPA
ncbi:MAG: hypothetical protein QOE14_1754 [Humisphaera sp.]|nr:hypothetical protein [Humisphaera sp.]